MRITSSLTILALALLSLSAGAQQAGNYVQYSNFDAGQNMRFQSVAKSAHLVSDNQLEIKINALFNRKATSYVAVFNIAQLGKTTEETNNLLNQRLEAFVADIKALGVPSNGIFVDMVNFLPKYELDGSKKLFSKKTYTEIPRGFELQKNVHIRYTDPTLLDRIVTAAAKQEIYDLVKVDYFDDNPNAVYAELREKSFQYLQQIKTSYKKISLDLDTAYVISGENSWVAFPGNRYESYQAYSTQSFEALDKGATVNTVDKPVSRFYNAVPANDYDIIINPEVIEPVIQYSYNLVVRFTLKTSVKADSSKSYFWLTPEGEVRPVEIGN